MTYFDRVTGPFKRRRGSHRDEYEIKFWVGATLVGGSHFASKAEAQAARKSAQAMVDSRSEATAEEVAASSPMEMSKRLDFWLFSLWESFRNCKTDEDAKVLAAKSAAMGKAQRAILLVGGTTETPLTDLKNIPQEELEKRLKVVK